MSETTQALYVALPETIKYRLDRFALENKLTLREAAIKIFDENLPQYEE